MSERTRTGTALLCIAAVLTTVVVGALWWAKPLTVTVSGLLAPDDATFITRLVLQKASIRQSVEELNGVIARIENLSALAEGLPVTRKAIYIDPQPDGSVLAEWSIACPGMCGGVVTYRIKRDTVGWRITGVESAISF